MFSCQKVVFNEDILVNIFEDICKLKGLCKHYFEVISVIYLIHFYFSEEKILTAVDLLTMLK